MAARAEIHLGTMNFGKRTAQAEARRIIDRAFERGVRWFDTANVYNEGESERILGSALRERRGEARIATKVGLARPGGKPEGLSRAAILAAVEQSLSRLGTDVIDVYYLHAPSAATPLEETLSAMAEIMAAGKVRDFGVSNFAAWQILEIFALCDTLGMRRPVMSQVLYNLLVRQIEIEYFAFRARHPIHTTVYNPLAGGILAGAPGARFEGNALYQRRYLSPRMIELAESHRALAAEAGMSLVDLSYAWLAARPGVDSILIGPASVAHLDAALDGCARDLPPGAGEKIDAVHRAYLGTDASYAR